MIADTPHANQQAATPEGPFVRAINLAILGLLLLSFSYLAVCVFASVWLTFQVPITDEDMRNASFLSTRVGFYWHGSVMGHGLALFGVLNLLGGRVIGVFMIVAGMSIVFATSEVSALRQGILNGDLKIGCYSYESLECRKMLQLPEGDTKSVYRDPGEMGHGGYAEWYVPIRDQADAKVTAVLPNTVPGVAFLQSPFVAGFHLDELKNLVAVQREEVAHFKAALAKQ